MRLDGLRWDWVSWGKTVVACVAWLSGEGEGREQGTGASATSPLQFPLPSPSPESQATQAKTVGMGEMSWGGTGWFGVRPIVLLYDGLVQVQYSKKLKTM